MGPQLDDFSRNLLRDLRTVLSVPGLREEPWQKATMLDIARKIAPAALRRAIHAEAENDHLRLLLREALDSLQSMDLCRQVQARIQRALAAAGIDLEDT